MCRIRAAGQLQGAQTMLGANEAEYARERARLSARVAQVCRPDDCLIMDADLLICWAGHVAGRVVGCTGRSFGRRVIACCQTGAALLVLLHASCLGAVKIRSRVQLCWLGYTACSSPCKHLTSCLGAIVISATASGMSCPKTGSKNNGVCPLHHML